MDNLFVCLVIALVQYLSYWANYPVQHQISPSPRRAQFTPQHTIVPFFRKGQGPVVEDAETSFMKLKLELQVGDMELDEMDAEIAASEARSAELRKQFEELTAESAATQAEWEAEMDARAAARDAQLAEWEAARVAREAARTANQAQWDANAAQRAAEFEARQKRIEELKGKEAKAAQPPRIVDRKATELTPSIFLSLVKAQEKVLFRFFYCWAPSRAIAKGTNFAQIGTSIVELLESFEEWYEFPIIDVGEDFPRILSNEGNEAQEEEEPDASAAEPATCALTCELPLAIKEAQSLIAPSTTTPTKKDSSMLNNIVLVLLHFFFMSLASLGLMDESTITPTIIMFNNIVPFIRPLTPEQKEALEAQQEAEYQELIDLMHKDHEAQRELRRLERSLMGPSPAELRIMELQLKLQISDARLAELSDEIAEIHARAEQEQAQIDAKYEAIQEELDVERAQIEAEAAQQQAEYEAKRAARAAEIAALKESIAQRKDAAGEQTPTEQAQEQPAQQPTTQKERFMSNSTLSASTFLSLVAAQETSLYRFFYCWAPTRELINSTNFYNIGAAILGHLNNLPEGFEFPIINPAEEFSTIVSQEWDEAQEGVEEYEYDQSQDYDEVAYFEWLAYNSHVLESEPEFTFNFVWEFISQVEQQVGQFLYEFQEVREVLCLNWAEAIIHMLNTCEEGWVFYTEEESLVVEQEELNLENDFAPHSKMIPVADPVEPKMVPVADSVESPEPFITIDVVAIESSDAPDQNVEVQARATRIANRVLEIRAAKIAAQAPTWVVVNSPSLSPIELPAPKVETIQAQPQAWVVVTPVCFSPEASTWVAPQPTAREEFMALINEQQPTAVSIAQPKASNAGKGFGKSTAKKGKGKSRK